MQVKDLKKFLTIPRLDEELELVLKVKQSNTVGPIPFVKIKNFSIGFDWDIGKILICPEEDICKSSFETAETISNLQEKLGWLEYENYNLKLEIKKLKGK